MVPQWEVDHLPGRAPPTARYLCRPPGRHPRREAHPLTESGKCGGRLVTQRPTIVFSRLVGGSGDIYVMDPNGSDMHPLIETPKDEFDPAYSPNGKQVVYTSNDTASGYLNIFRAGIVTGTPHELSFEFAQRVRAELAAAGMKDRPIVRAVWICALYAAPALIAVFLVFLRRDVAGE